MVRKELRRAVTRSLVRRRILLLTPPLNEPRHFELKLDLLLIVVELMFDGELGALWNSNPLARDLDPERLVLSKASARRRSLATTSRVE